MINPRISAGWSANKPIEAFSCTQVHFKAEVLHFSPGLQGFTAVSCNVYAGQRDTPLKNFRLP